MKKLLTFSLVVLLCFSFAATALASAPDAIPPIDNASDNASPIDPYWAEKMSVPYISLIDGVSSHNADGSLSELSWDDFYTVPDDCVTDEMRATRAEILEKYPGLVPVDPASIDPSLPFIYLDSIEELDRLMAGVSAAHIYKGRS